MNVQKLKAQIRSGEIDTIVVACPDVFGRLVGKRFTGKFFLDHVAAHIPNDAQTVALLARVHAVRNGHTPVDAVLESRPR